MRFNSREFLIWKERGKGLERDRGVGERVSPASIFKVRLGLGEIQGRYRETERQRDRETERQRDRETETQRDRETERQRDRETERQRDRETERQRDRADNKNSQQSRVAQLV
jgi:hypothetical protein